MQDVELFPKIIPGARDGAAQGINPHYLDAAQNLLLHLMPEEILEKFPEDMDGFCDDFHGHLPLVATSDFFEPPFHLSVYLLCDYRLNATKFFYDMIHRWLYPGKKLNIGLFFATDFHFEAIPGEMYTIAEMAIPVLNEEDAGIIERNFPMIAREIRLGIGSIYQANRILELKGLSIDEKTAHVQERVHRLVQRLPNLFDYDIFTAMQHFLVTTGEVFKGVREAQHLCRIIYLTYLLGIWVKEALELNPNGRHIRLKLINTKLHEPLGTRRVLSLFVAINFLRENEVFEKRHLFGALKALNPEIKIVDGSYLIFEKREDRMQTLYLELEKGTEAEFSLDEVKKIQKDLPGLLRASIEQLIRPVFMPRNEEEVMRNIVLLSQQLKYVRDLPHVIISFDEQTDQDLVFTVVIVRILRPGAKSITELFEKSETSLTFIPDRVKIVGKLRKKYVKEATVFRLKLNSRPFLRQDHSVDLYRARQTLLSKLQKVIGEVRDYNGGMISKQNELFLALQKSLGDQGQKNHWLLENFFHSIFPIELRSVLKEGPLKTLFLMLRGMVVMPRRSETTFDEVVENEALFILVGLQNLSLKQKLLDRVFEMKVASMQLVRLHFQYFETSYLGFIYFSDDATKQRGFLSAVKQVLDIKEETS